MNVFDYVNSISDNKRDIYSESDGDATYVPFIVNRALSYYADTVLYANEINIHNQIPKQWQYDFLRNAIPRRKRFSKWAKKPPVTDDVIAVQEKYKYSTEKAIEVLSILTPQQLQSIHQSMDKGGKT
jgi:hypothetical protein